MREVTGNPRRVACDKCTRMKEKCVWLEVVMGSSGTGKGKAVETSLQAGERKKWQRKVTVKKAAADDDDNMELVEGPSKASPSKKAGPKPTRREGVEERLDWVVDALGDLTTVIHGLAANHVVLMRQTRTLANITFEYVLRTYKEYTSESEGPEEFDEDVETLRAENWDLGNLDTLAAWGENAKAIIAHYKDHLARTGSAPDAPKDV